MATDTKKVTPRPVAAQPVAAKPVVAAPVAPVTAPVTAPVSTLVGAATVATAAPTEEAAAAPAAKKGGPGMIREDFAIATAVDAAGASVVDANGKLTATPANWNMNKHKSFKQEDFVDEPTFMEYKASVSDLWAKRYIDAAANYRAQAINIRKFGNADDLKRMNKLEKMRKEYAALAAEMAAEGIHVDALPEITAATAAA